ncbi:heterogeneous nuclear ribonucleoprotein 27C isoform X6 [Monomorium pharaonis]|uniref:heterogeneous nuclear ribonucleoprotein 27C isoform X6 n=1 Tax=Monomorium pharaonis TaxID=307658 RepID=UPI00102E1DA4|nr:heterogeneous nuclear ribonucleoprotein 27C isoform X6 [Monomorium pharaonis]
MRVKTEMDDDEKGKLFVGGLSWETTQENLQRYFGRYGEVIDCVVMKNSESGRSRGFGFVTFSDPANVSLVLQNGPHQLDGRTIDPKPCNPRTLQKPKRSGGFPKVFLGGLPSNVTETDLRSYFTRFGKVMEVVIMYDQEKKKSRGFGFLSFEDEEAVDRCVAEHFVNLNGKQVEIKRAEPRDSSSKMNDSHQGQWGPPQQGGPPMGMAGNMGPMGGPNGQMGGPMMGGPMGPPGNMMQQYQGWGTSPQTGGYAGYSPLSPTPRSPTPTRTPLARRVTCIRAKILVQVRQDPAAVQLRLLIILGTLRTVIMLILLILSVRIREEKIAKAPDMDRRAFLLRQEPTTTAVDPKGVTQDLHRTPTIIILIAAKRNKTEPRVSGSVREPSYLLCC